MNTWNRKVGVDRKRERGGGREVGRRRIWKIVVRGQKVIDTVDSQGTYDLDLGLELGQP